MGVPRQPGRRTAPNLLLSLAAGAVALGLAACGTEVAGSGAVPRAAAAQASALVTDRAGPAAAQRPSVLPSEINPGGPMIPAHGTPALCAAVPAVSRLVVSPLRGLSQRHMHPALPAGIAVRSAAQARAVARALCALPRLPTALHCPPDLGAGYRLGFTAGQVTFPVVSAATSGCRWVTGAGPTRWTARTPRFWAVFHHAIAAR